MVYFWIDYQKLTISHHDEYCTYALWNHSIFRRQDIVRFTNPAIPINLFIAGFADYCMQCKGAQEPRQNGQDNCWKGMRGQTLVVKSRRALKMQVRWRCNQNAQLAAPLFRVLYFVCVIPVRYVSTGPNSFNLDISFQNIHGQEIQLLPVP